MNKYEHRTRMPCGCNITFSIGEWDFPSYMWEKCNLHVVAETLANRLRHTRNLARTGLAPMAMNMTQAQWDSHRINTLEGEITQLIDDLEKEPEKD